MRDPYLYDDVNVLKNLADIKNSELLRKAEADITGLAMAAIYDYKYDKFNTETLQDIHRNIFGQIFDWAGEFRTIQMAKYEDVLGGDTVRYAYPKEIKKQLNETMKEIAKLKRTGDNDKDIVFKLVRIIASIWQTHPFREGNTRTVIVFAVLLAKSLGFEVEHELFKTNSAYVRNALVWESQGIYSKYEYLERIFFDAILGEDNETDAPTETKSSKYDTIGEYKVKDYKERPHEYLDEKCNQFKTKIYLEGDKMTENQKYEVLRKQKVEELTKQLKALLPKILERYTFNEDKPDDLKSQELSLNAKIGSKNNTYLNITNDVITSPDQYVSMWFDGLLNHIEVVDKGMEEIRAAYNFQQLLVNDDDLMQYTILFLKRTYWRNCYSISKLRPTEKDAELWIGQKNAVYGLLITPRFKNGNWENDVSEIRRFRQDYFTIGHILETGLVIPYENDKIKFNSVDEYLTFFKNVLVRLSGSPYELKIAELYCEYVRSSANPYKVPLLIPELRYNGLENNHVYRLDFTIINPITLEKHGFEFSPWSTHGYLGGIKGKTQKEVNEEAKANFEHEMKKHKDYYRNLNIFTLIYTDTDLQGINNIFADMKEYLAPKRENKQLLESVIERIKNYRKTP